MTDVIFLPFLTRSKSIDYKHLIFYLSSPPFSLVAGFNIIASGGDLGHYAIGAWVGSGEVHFHRSRGQRTGI